MQELVVLVCRGIRGAVAGAGAQVRGQGVCVCVSVCVCVNERALCVYIGVAAHVRVEVWRMCRTRVRPWRQPMPGKSP